MALAKVVNVPKKQEESSLETFAKLLGIGIQLGSLGSGIYGAVNPGQAAMVPPAVGQKFSLLSPQDWQQLGMIQPMNTGVGFPGPIIGSK